MRIEFWVDYLCPITYLTHENLLEAIRELKLTEYEIYYRSYILDEPLFNELKDDLEVKKIIKEYLPKLKDYSHFDTSYIHQLAHLAKWEGKALEFAKEVLRSIFIENIDLTNNDELTKVATSIGLLESDVSNVLETCCYTKQIDTNKQNAKNKGIKSIPHLRINIKNNYSGFYSKDELVEILNKVIKKSNQAKTECDGEICAY